MNMMKPIDAAAVTKTGNGAVLRLLEQQHLEAFRAAQILEAAFDVGSDAAWTKVKEIGEAVACFKPDTYEAFATKVRVLVRAAQALKDNPFGHLKQSDHRRKAWNEAWKSCAISDAEAECVTRDGDF